MRNQSLAKEVKGVLWDLDGVIVDTHEWHILAMLEALGTYGFSATREELHGHFGTSTEKIIRAVIKEKATDENVAAIRQKHSDVFCEAVIGKVVPFPGAVELVKMFKQRGIKQAIASSSTTAIIETLLGEIGILQDFDQIISGADLPPKPSPVVFQEAAKSLGLTPDECVVIEDSPMGIHGAKTGGMRCLAVATSRAEDALTEADLIVSRLNTVQDETLAALGFA